MLQSQHKGTNTPSIRIPAVDEERMMLELMHCFLQFLDTDGWVT